MNKKKNKVILFTFFACIVLAFITAVFTYSELNNRVVDSSLTHAGGVVDNVVYVDDTESDYYYYMGLNYTSSSNGSLPSGENQQIYTDTNLVQVRVNYSSIDLNNGYTGYISNTELQDTFVYYKVYPVNDNGTTSKSDDYILIELIDNPFLNYPNSKSFNGWNTTDTSITLSIDLNYYKRYAKVPVTYTSNYPDKMEVTFYASWAPAKIGYVNGSNSWDNAFSYLNTRGLKDLDAWMIEYADVDMSGYYHQEIISRGDSCTGLYNNKGQRQNNCTCNAGSWWNPGTCTYYSLITNENFDENNTYYYLSGGNMTELDNSTVDREIIGEGFANGFSEDSLMTGYYRLVTLTSGDLLSGYYDINGVMQTSGTCSNTCTYYELIPYKDSEGNLETFQADEDYYYLSTRDTNIIVMNGNVSTTWSGNKPFTLTSLYNGEDYRNSVTWDVSNLTVQCYEDTKIENIKISSNQNSANSTPPTLNSSRVLYGNWHNVKLGRGIVQNGSYKTFDTVIGGNNASVGSSSNIKKYTLAIESGFYNSISMGAGSSGWFNYSMYIEGKAIYGNDYDRAIGNNNNLDIYYCASGSWGHNYYASTTTGISFDLTVKSGKFGSGKAGLTTGIYVGGRQGGTHYTSRRAKIEGGWIYNLIGGPLTASNRSRYNDSYIYVTGGEVDMITGGAGQTATYGNRIIQVTGGTVNYSVFGGSNGSTGNDGDGTVNGSSFIYIGGNATIGSSDNVDNDATLYGAEAGSVFGIGNGKQGSTTIGSSDNSYIIVDGEAVILRNVYGGGNFGAVGISSSQDTTTTHIDIKGGTIQGSVYGGGNNNGSGSNSTASSIYINMIDGHVLGSIYGGANQLGTIYGSTNVNVYGGTVEGSVYGGGQGGYSSSSDIGTFVSGNSTVVIGNNIGGPTIRTNVYGGSAFGTVNATTTGTTSNYTTKVSVYNGNILNSVFGGGQGDATYTPYVSGDVTVTIYNGNINNVFGGNDEAGTPSKNVEVYIKGGTIQNVYGGGNKTSQPATNVYMQGGTTTNVFGGSNQQGTVNTSNILVTDGTLSNVYGGNNIGGTTETSNVTINGGTINIAYGGGKLATTNISNVTLNSSSIRDVYGGGESADISTSTNILLNGSTVINLYGGSNVIGTVAESNIEVIKGIVATIYGGNNAGGTTTTTNLNIKGGTITDIYGGGNEAATITSNVDVYFADNVISNVFGGGKKANVDDTNVNIYGSKIENVYGGSNQDGIVSNSYVTIDKQTTVDNSVTMDVTVTASDTESWQSDDYITQATLNVTITNNTQNSIDDWNASIFAPNSTLNTNYSSTEIIENNGTYSFEETNRYYGINSIGANGSYSFEFTIYSNEPKEDFTVDYVFSGLNDVSNYNATNLTSPKINTVYGGNNAGGKTINTNVLIQSGNILLAYGGGNEAVADNTFIKTTDAIVGSVYGGGNQATVTYATNTDILGTTIKNDVFGGGNQGQVGTDTDVYVSDAIVGGSIYAGGNGVSATVLGNILLNVDGSTNVTKSIFGGGNAAATGTETSNSSKSIVNIAGATVGKNVYGGANTSVLYGTVELNIGYALVDSSLKKGDIVIVGTVFGGGEANASGSEDYDYSFISVTTGITINIDGSLNDILDMTGSIFGSGNASSTTGYSYINISNYGTNEKWQKNISIQRADIVTMDNSYMELSGATDRTNDYSTTLFSLSRIKHIKLKNNSILYLQTGANLLEKFSSLVDVDGIEFPAQVTIAEDGTVIKNVDNRIYMYDGKILNIATNQQVTAYGDVVGMTFFGRYVHDRNGYADTGLYSSDYNNGDAADTNDLYLFSKSSYVLGRHYTNHDITVDGFYTNYNDEDNPGYIKTAYIEPTPEDASYYMWVIGELVSSYDIELVASKYSTLGTYELPLINSASANTTFSVVGFNFNDVNSDFELVDEREIPRISKDGTADTKMGLTMKSSNTGWITVGETSFYTSDTPILGTIDYKSENSSTVPSLLFYLYHSKNLQTAGSIGTVTISLLAITPIDDLTNDVNRININITLSRALYNTNDYEAAMTAGEKFDMFASTATDITATSKLSAYYSLFVDTDTTIYKTGDYRALVSSFVLPKDTKITMVDLNTEQKDYYYYVVSEEDVTTAQQEYNLYGEASYKLSKFIKMGSTSTNNNYNDAEGNNSYFDAENGFIQEEFIFIVDFANSGITSNQLDNTLLIELRNSGNQTMISVLGVQHANMTYNLYNEHALIDLDATIDSQKIYLGQKAKLDVTTTFTQPEMNSRIVYDTNYFNEKLGIKISLYDKDGSLVNGASLLGVSFKSNNVVYYPRVDGSVRINIAERVANVSSKIEIDTTYSTLASGSYTLRVESFGSADGIYYGLTSSDVVDIPITIVSNLFGLKVDLPDDSVIIDKATGKGDNDNNAMVFTIHYTSGLSNPNLRISMYRRNYDEVYSSAYEKVDIKDYVTNTLIDRGDYNYLLFDNPHETQTLFLYTRESLKSGTYKIVFSLYDDNTYIGEVYQYVIIK